MRQTNLKKIPRLPRRHRPIRKCPPPAKPGSRGSRRRRPTIRSRPTATSSHWPGANGIDATIENVYSSGMLLAQMEGFLEVARRGNVSRAADAMFVTQPTLTARLHALERELGEPLFARTRRGMKLTDAGRAFL